MNLLTKKILPLVVLGAFIVIAYTVTSFPPSAKKARPSNSPQLMVDVQTLMLKDLTLSLSSYGTVQPRTQSMLLPQVSGQINAISPNFHEGGFFKKGEVLVEIDDRDYQVEIKIAQASLFTAKQALSEEQARVEQALQDWQRLGNEDKAPDLVLRKPQLLAAQATVLSAEAKLSKAKLALERTRIKAPYDGRILNKYVDIGQVVSLSNQLAEIYATDYVEIRLPLKNIDLPYIELPENDKNNNFISQSYPKVSIFSEISVKQEWLGHIVRTEGAFDQNAQQLYVVAQVDDPYGITDRNTMPIKIGQYVSASIQGRTLHNVLAIPNSAIYQGSYVYLVENNRLIRKELSIAWQNETFSIITSGLKENQHLVLTPLGQVTSGTLVSISSIDGVVNKKVGLTKSERLAKKDNKANGESK
ncbi:efflux RND transporter periplasmic adaptor subunit [Colwellia sp. RSH04]|uniref:efflux RND transporter periplasmic adaptor subunit n=1 Tax=Colwellia sp. RSH04 TaxID=2305464 RepID=UPI000E58A15C|nr:efflux RND transporter periplasmic adaptor subunit [Colwellia sp. RSH04]RHW77242.1 efflux RND transporter periplasmic adaptor subunit [Colwellia sp. RSH04]